MPALRNLTEIPVFKTLLRVTMAFGVLLASYAGYTRGFALVVEGLSARKDDQVYTHAVAESKTKRQAINLAIQGFGKGHWAADEALPIRIYNAERGFWIYAQDYKRLNDGKQIEFTPFALIWRSRDGRGLKTVTSRSATVDLDEPLGLISKPGAGGTMKVVHARIEGEVLLRDDKSTSDPADDFKISGPTYLEYDEASLQIIGDDKDTVVMEDAVYRVLGKGLLIKLRPVEPGLGSESSSGFNGAQTAILKRDVFITIFDVGPGGMLPGNPGTKRKKAGEPTPLTARSDGMLQVDLPKPRIPVRVGPPAPPDPTFAHFHRNVEVLRGKTGRLQDQLYSDTLRLTLVPPEKEAKTPDPTPIDDEGFDDLESESSEGSLVLKRAEATGHNVRLFSMAQGLKAHGKELIHKKLMPDAPDETYMRGDAGTKLVVEKTDIAQTGPDKGKVTGFTIIRTIDATIFDDGLGNDHATIVARGPGDLESRPGLNAPVERTARWLDQLTLQAETTRDATGAQVVTGKRLTLTGSPAFNDLAAETKLAARDLIVVFLKPNGKTAAAAPAVAKTNDLFKENDPAVAPAAYEIERLFARQDVHLDAPSKSLVAREWLDAHFESQAAASPPTVTAIAASSPVPTEGDAKTNPAEAKPQPTKPVEPLAKATANRVSAKILLHPNAGKTPGLDGNNGTGTARPASTSLSGGGQNQGSEIKTVLLRGAVTIHQDPGPGKSRGTDAVGEAVDIYNRGPEAAKFVIFHRDPRSGPRALKPGSDLPGSSRPAVPQAADDLDADLIPLARIDIDDMTFRGKIIGLDQTTDEAWIDGGGSLTKLAAVGLLSDKGLSGQTSPAAKPGSPRGEKPAANAGSRPAAAAASPAKTTPMTITFDSRMKFFGRSTNMKGQPAGRAEFYKNVHAENSESILDCKDVMKVYLDRPVKLARAKNTAALPPGETEPNSEIAEIECVEDVVAITEKLDPASKQVLQKQRIEGDHLVYEKLTGNFFMKTPGIVYLYEREGQSGQGLGVPGANAPRSAGPAAGGANGHGRVIRPTSGPGDGQKAPVIGHNGVRKPADLKAPARLGSAAGPPQALAARRTLPPLVLTQVRFSREMAGRFGSGKVSDKAEIRWADFFGEVEALRGRVPDADAVLDPDKLLADGQFLTSEILRVVSDPSPFNPDGPPRYLLAAWENAFARDNDTTIQADRITYDTTSNLFYAYGDEGREVLIAQQEQIGQPATFSRTGGWRYNAKTGQSTLIDLKVGSMIQARTGTRPKPFGVPGPIGPRSQKRTKLRNPRNIERKDFTGR